MATTAPSVPAKAAPPRGWFRRNWKWFIPASILTAALVALIVAAGVIGVRVNRYKSSTPYQTALAIVQESPQVQKPCWARRSKMPVGFPPARSKFQSMAAAGPRRSISRYRGRKGRRSCKPRPGWWKRSGT